MTDVSIFDESSQSAAKVSAIGELFIAPISYSVPFFVSVDAAATPFEIIPSISGKKFVVTGMLLATSKTFGSATTAETLTLYEASPADLAANTKTFAQIDFLKNDRLVATGMNIITSANTSLVASATDTDVGVTISGYYVVC